MLKTGFPSCVATAIAAALMLAPPVAAQDPGDPSGAIRNRLAQEAHDRQMANEHYQREAQAQQARQGQAAYGSGEFAPPPSAPPEYADPENDALERTIGEALAATREALALMQEAQVAQAVLDADPAYQAWLNGAWEHYQESRTARPGQHCAATFWSKDGIITIKGPDELYSGATLFFSAEGLPKPDADQDIPITLIQDQDPPVRVIVRNMARTAGTGETGTVAIVVPTIEDALAGMLEEQEFTIMIDNREAFRMSWREGLAARERLRQCVSQRRS